MSTSPAAGPSAPAQAHEETVLVRRPRTAAAPAAAPAVLVDLVRYRRVDALCVLHLALGFFPYAAVPIGASSNVPLCCLTGLALLVLTRARQGVGLYLMIALTPLASAFVLVITGAAHQASVKSVVIWPVWILMLLGAIEAGRVMPVRLLLRTLQAALAATALYAIVQYFLILRGRLLDFGVRHMQPYADLTSDEARYTLLHYERRPFGWFPEPSVLAGTLGLVAIAVLVVEQVHGQRSRGTLPAVLSAVYAIFCAASGSAAASLPAIAVLLFLRPRKGEDNRFLLFTPVVLTAGFMVYKVLQSRSGPDDYSWTDRLASLREPLDYQLGHVTSTLFGLGPGNGARLLQERVIPIAAGEVTRYPGGINSGVGNLVIECGFLLGGAATLVLLAVMFARLCRITTPLGAGVAVAVWAFIAIFVIGYQTVAWLWTFPGLVIGLSYRVSDPSTWQRKP